MTHPAPSTSKNSPEAAALNEAERQRIQAKSALFAPPPATTDDGRKELVGLSREELIQELVAIGEKPFRAKQVWHWIYHQGGNRLFSDEQHRQATSGQARSTFCGEPSRYCDRTNLQRRDTQVPLPLPRWARG